jgi:hypothetical protein
MPRMGSYCRAYYARDFAAFAGWHPDLAQLRPAVADVEGREVHVQRAALEGDDILYLQEDLSVTDGIFLDEHVVFVGTGPDWRAFCSQTLGFDPGSEDEAAGEPAHVSEPQSVAA